MSVLVDEQVKPWIKHQKIILYIRFQQELIDVIEYQTKKAVEYTYKAPLLLKEAERKKLKAFKVSLR